MLEGFGRMNSEHTGEHHNGYYVHPDELGVLWKVEHTRDHENGYYVEMNI